MRQRQRWKSKLMIKFEKIPADVLSRMPKVIEIIAEDANVVFAYLFGGLAKGQIRPLSDVDIAAYVNSTENLAEYKLDLFDRITDAIV